MNETLPVSEKKYPFREIEAKWKDAWARQGTYRFDWKSPKKKFYVLTMFSYPSGDKLHMGHWYCYAPTDSFARFKRMQGYNVFEPMGFDAFGLPAENYAIKTGIHPAISTAQNVNFMREQLKQIGAMYDWDYEVNTSSPEYYKWTQWWFLLFYKMGLAYQKDALVNWCPNDQTVLANEQVSSDNTCERCGAEIIRKSLKQWFFKITDYNQRLLDGLNDIDWPEKTKAMQRYWIGKSQGCEISFQIPPPESPPLKQGGEDEAPPNPPATRGGEKIKVFTTRADTLFGVTYVVLAPEHELVKLITTPDRKDDVEKYVASALAMSEVDRAMTDRVKTGAFTGAYAIHPFTNEKLPVWVADYVIGSYGTGAVMAVPAHDERDFEFAKQYGLPIKKVIAQRPPLSPPHGVEGKETPPNPPATRGGECFTEYGVMFDSGEFSGLSSEEGIRKIGERLESEGKGRPTVTWHLRDWTISRQRYWGAPIPIIHCKKCGIVPVPEEDLPVRLPEDVEEFKPKGKSPLANVESFINVKCPTCGGKAERDPDTMDTFVDSSWYFLRYPDAHLSEAPFDKKHLIEMFPVDQYIGGPEHAMGHLIYSRFFAKVAKDAGWFPYEEPFSRLVHQGIILNRGERMSKSKGNVVAPEPVLERVGSDVLRCYLMFSGDYTQGGDWNDSGIAGVERFIARVWRLGMAIANGSRPKSPPLKQGGEIPEDVDRKIQQTIKEVGKDLESLSFNTGIARLMELTNSLYGWVGSDLKSVERTSATISAVEQLVRLIAPFAPHLAEEIWSALGHSTTVFDEPWPSFDEERAKDNTVTIAVQINGKLRDTFEAEIDSAKESLETSALSLQKIKAAVDGKQVAKIIVVPNRIVNVVVK